MATFKSGFWSSGPTTSKRSTGVTTSPAPGYKNVWNCFNQKIASYKTLCGQASGPARFTRPSPTTLNTMAKWIDKGAVVHKISGAQVKRWSKSNKAFKSAASAKTVLAKRFGKSTIKAVTTDKGGAFLVACSSKVKGKTFNFPR